VLEGPTSSFFWVRGGVLHTPPLGEHILSSITRAAIVEGLGAREESCTRADLDGVEEAFLASTVREVIPVSAIDGRPLPAAPGPVTTAARTALHERIERELARA
jgi:branched-chain amino acid aminotransferase